MLRYDTIIECLGEEIRSRHRLSGGDIASTHRIETVSGRIFVLKESEGAGRTEAGMSRTGSSGGSLAFSAEADGLVALGATGAIRVPEVIGYGEKFLLMEWIETCSPAAGFFSDFGRALARLHRNRGPSFGYPRDNFIGKLPQDNTPAGKIHEFFAERRFRHLLRLGVDSGAIDHRLRTAVEAVCRNLHELLAPINEPPALLHGDLWSGNFLVSNESEVVIIDPAVYYGPREADIAMTKLFGGFSADFCAAYDAEYPLPEGWSDRVDLFNLYHLLTHTIMFGGGYAAQALAMARKYS